MKQAVLVKLIIPQLIFFLSSTFQNDRWGTKRPLISSWMETSTKPERSQFALASGRLLVVNYCLSVFISSLLFFFLIYSGILNRENYESAALALMQLQKRNIIIVIKILIEIFFSGSFLIITDKRLDSKNCCHVGTSQ